MAGSLSELFYYDAFEAVLTYKDFFLPQNISFSALSTFLETNFYLF